MRLLLVSKPSLTVPEALGKASRTNYYRGLDISVKLGIILVSVPVVAINKCIFASVDEHLKSLYNFMNSVRLNLPIMVGPYADEKYPCALLGVFQRLPFSPHRLWPV
jgi:hypothetical protein